MWIACVPEDLENSHEFHSSYPKRFNKEICNNKASKKRNPQANIRVNTTNKQQRGRKKIDKIKIYVQ